MNKKSRAVDYIKEAQSLKALDAYIEIGSTTTRAYAKEPSIFCPKQHNFCRYANRSSNAEPMIDAKSSRIGLDVDASVTEQPLLHNFGKPNLELSLIQIFVRRNPAKKPRSTGALHKGKTTCYHISSSTPLANLSSLIGSPKCPTAIFETKSGHWRPFAGKPGKHLGVSLCGAQTLACAWSGQKYMNQSEAADGSRTLIGCC